MALACAGAARADDAEAARLLRDAIARWDDPSPDEAVRLTEEALAAASSARVKANALLLLGSLHQAKTGKVDEALQRYDEVEAALAQETAPQARSLLAQALVRKATLVYAERDDAQAALDIYRRAQEADPSAQTADSAAQMCYREGRRAAAEADRARWLELALALAREALELNARPRSPDRPRREGQGPGRGRDAFRARAGVQLVLVLEALGRKDEAAAAWAEVPQDALDDSGQYQMALLHAVRGDLAAAGVALRRFMTLRPTPSTRNQLRKFIREEPDLQGGLEREDWKELVVDEQPAAPQATPPR